MGQTICIFGDSIAWGANDLEKGGWVNRLRLFLDNSGNGSFVYNLSIAGETSEDLIKRFDNEADVRFPNIVIFAIGVNDSVYSTQKGSSMVDEEIFRSNIEFLINKAKRFTDNIVMIGLCNADESRTNPIPWQTNYSYKNQEIKRYSETIRVISEKNRCIFIDVFDILDVNDLDDGLHPNASGHEKLFQTIKDTMMKKNVI